MILILNPAMQPYMKNEYKWFECPSETWRNKQQNSWRPPPSSWVAIPTGAVQFGASRSVVSSCFDSKCYPDQIKSTGFRSITCWLSPYRSRHLGGLCRIISSPTSRTLDRKKWPSRLFSGLFACQNMSRFHQYYGDEYLIEFPTGSGQKVGV